MNMIKASTFGGGAEERGGEGFYINPMPSHRLAAELSQRASLFGDSPTKNPIFCSVFHKNMDFHMVSYMILRVFHMVLHRVCFPQNFPQVIKSVLSEFSTKISTKCDFYRKKHEFERTSIRILFKFCRNLARSCKELRRIPIELVKIS